MKKENNEPIKEINHALQKIQSHQESENMFSELDKAFENADRRAENAINGIINTFNRIHDKAVDFNTLLIFAYLYFGTIASEYSNFRLLAIVYPVLNFLYLVYIKIKQMKTYRFSCKEQEWTKEERNEFDLKINKLTQLCFIAILISIVCLMYLIKQI